MNRALLCAAVLALLAAAHFASAGKDQVDPRDTPRLRRPMALALSSDESLLYVANRRSGSVSIIDVKSRKLIAEQDLGKQLADLKPLPDGKGLLAVDESAHQLLVLRFTDEGRLSVRQRLDVSPYPVDVAISADGRRCYVASLWSRRITCVDLSEDAARIAKQIDLPYAPRRQLLVDGDKRLIAADSFGGRLGVLDVRDGKLLSVRKFPGHNVRGLGVSKNGKMLLVAHQMLNELAHTVRNDVHWGLLMSNDLRWLRLSAVLDAKSDMYDGAHMHPLGEAGSATADPSALVVASNGAVVVTLGGVGEIALGKEDDFSLYRIKVGKRPTAVVVSKDGKLAFVANTFGDSVSIVDLESREGLAEVSLGPQAKLSVVDKGELLFFDANLSHDAWMSCHSCHTDGHTNGMMNDNLSDASFGAPKRVLSLLGRAGTEPFAWNAETKSYAEQIRNSIMKTMQSDEDPREADVVALTAFLRTLEPPPAIDKLRGVHDEGKVARGEKLFSQLDCKTCHAPPLFTTPATYDVGLRDKQGNEKFNPPTLRGVAQRGPYFHDNRASTLEDVFRVHGHQLKEELGEVELGDLIAFLRSL